ncbi:MAG: MBL fold metallo-hydrolase [Gammaproteobacteria bacterium]
MTDSEDTHAIRPARLVAVASLTALLWLPCAQAQTLNVTLIGTGDPIPRLDRFGPATLVEAGEHRMLFDVGRGAAQRLGQLGIALGDIDELFITHFHHDHLIGIADVWMTGWLPNPFGRRSMPLRVWGPTGTQDILDGLRQAMDPNIQIRIVDEQLPPAGAEFEAHEFSEDGVVFDEDGIVVTAFAVDHGQYIKPSYGYRIDYAGHSVVISGDTKFDENLIEISEGVDVLIHEVAAANVEILEFDPRMQLILDHHTTPEEAGTVFARAEPKLAVYTHYVLLSAPNAPEVTVEKVVERTRTTYSGPLQTGDDLMRFEIGDTVKIVPFSP